MLASVTYFRYFPLYCFNSEFLHQTCFVFFSFTMQSFVKLVSQYFSRNFSFRVKSAISDFDSRNVPLVVGQKVGPFTNIEISCCVKVFRDRLMTLIFVSSPVVSLGVNRFLRPFLLRFFHYFHVACRRFLPYSPDCVGHQDW